MPRAAPSSSSSASSSSDDGDDDGVDETLAAMSDDAINARVAPSFYALTRSIDREDRRAFHRVHSIARDAAFVEAQGERFLRDSTRAAFANARAGAWYAGGGRFAYETCYFKSTDGHNNNWTMSATRLNRRVAMACAAGRGGMIVDATRSAVKRFPGCAVEDGADLVRRVEQGVREGEAGRGSGGRGRSRVVRGTAFAGVGGGTRAEQHTRARAGV